MTVPEAVHGDGCPGGGEGLAPGSARVWSEARSGGAGHGGGQGERLRASLLLEVASAPAPAAALVERLGPTAAGGVRRRAAYVALRSLEGDGLVVAFTDGSAGGTRRYRLSSLGEERLRRFGQLLDAALRHGRAACEPAQDRDRPARRSASCRSSNTVALHPSSRR